MRATLKDVKNSRIPELLGICPDDTARLAAIVNDALHRLILAGGDAGFWGSWSKVRFTVTALNPYITLPRELARIANMAIGRYPIYVHNEFYEVLPGGIGPMPPQDCVDWCGTVAGYERGVWPTKVDLTSANQRLRVYTTDDRDLGGQILIRGLDANGNTIYSQDGLNTVEGFNLVYASPFVDSSFDVSQILSVTKTVTFGDILLFHVDQTSGAETLLSRYLASETNPAYRRYYLHPLTLCNCDSFTVTAIAKHEFIPVLRDTDPLVLGNIPALTEMCQALRGYSMDVVTAHQIGGLHEQRALKLLRRELDHYLGQMTPAVAVDRLQQASFQRIGLSTNI